MNNAPESAPNSAQQPRQCGFVDAAGRRCQAPATTPSKGTARNLWACSAHAYALAGIGAEPPAVVFPPESRLLVRPKSIGPRP